MPEFDNTYSRLPDRFFSRVAPEPVDNPETIRVNTSLANRLGFDPEWLASQAGAEFATGNAIIDGSEPIAQVYAGHQFGGWVPQLGDGRAHLLGEVIDSEGARWDVQLKGSGRTPYSRRGDGRAPLGPVLREFLISESMNAMGIPTTRSLAAASTGEMVHRQQSEPGAVLVRVAQSHVRIGTFEYFVGRGDTDGLATLARYVARRHYPELDAESTDIGLQLLEAYADRIARLVAQWQNVGFIHGVMNTDNMLLSGETIDYGPCAFMNAYDPETVYSSIDRYGRYAFDNQPSIAQWNLSRLAEALLRVKEPEEADVDRARALLENFPQMFQDHFFEGLATKIGLEDGVDTRALVADLLEIMKQTSSDFTLTFRRLAARLRNSNVEGDPGELHREFDAWVRRWRESLDHDLSDVANQMDAINPLLIPRNHVVNAALEAAANGDLVPFHELADSVVKPFDQPGNEEFLRPPRPDEEIAATFCGT